MLRSMFSAISGLKAHQTKMDVVGNNIANVNTVGYKSQSTVFEDTLSQLMRNGSAPTAETAGTNPAQVGLGVKVASIATNFSQGSTQNTGRSSDFMISGDGFFMTKSGNETLYTRAGSFDFDGAGNLVTPDGAKLQGWTATNGVVNTNGPVGDLAIPYGQNMPPAATTNSSVVGNLSADAVATDAPVQTQVTMYDSLGNAHQVSYVFQKTATPNAWTADVLDQNGVTMLPTTTAPGPPPVTTTSKIPVTFNASTGAMTAPSGAAFTFTPPSSTYPSWAGPVTVDLTSVSQFGGKSTATATTPAAGAGSALGTLESFSLGNDGTITGIYSNGLRQPIGQLALATFANPSGLTKAGDTSYRVGDNSGNPLVGVAGTGGRGTLSAGALEMSNVDLSEEFTGLIIAQRGFQANSKVITTSDQILQDLVNMKS
jgi:flagellar hook protein FlgE